LRLGRLTITTDAGQFNYFATGDGHCCGGAILGFGPAIGNASDTGYFDVEFDHSVEQAGGWGGNGAGPVMFFDGNNRLLVTVALSLAVDEFGSTPTPQFEGWSDLNGVKRMRFTDVIQNNGILVLDRVTYSDSAPVAEPSSGLLLIAGLLVRKWRPRARNQEKR